MIYIIVLAAVAVALPSKTVHVVSNDPREARKHARTAKLDQVHEESLCNAVNYVFSVRLYQNQQYFYILNTISRSERFAEAYVARFLVRGGGQQKPRWGQATLIFIEYIFTGVHFPGPRRGYACICPCAPPSKFNQIITKLFKLPYPHGSLKQSIVTIAG
jgi:hypothetical protein